ncbi:hypothetical protein JCM24511_00117 [Saitozyma sp. JCM 24511]|uniref:Small EDRK-rich factor-like N-terminal domain-containing protein n=1 Tax=Saitozyma podzolica TaxID=1890683 RepID=A0A427YUT2_9TREE|nr:hypothetical protein EHS25_004648 [Saitozyma podzolica]GFZ42402.1 hypothetical protein JCM24511_00117 [Saitozyma sp. JCM 24511]
MTRGDQRDRAREKNLKAAGAKAKKQEGDPRKRAEHDAEMVRQKQKAKEEAARLAAAGGAPPPDPKSKVGVAAKQAQQKK